MEKLLAIIFFIQRARGRQLFQRLLPNIIVVVGLIIIVAIMISAVIISSLGLAYFILIKYGIETQAAIIIIAILAIFTIMALVLLTLYCLNRLRQIPQTMLNQSPLAARAIDTLDAFTSGLMAK